MATSDVARRPEPTVRPNGRRTRLLLVGKGQPERGGIPAHLDLLASELSRRHNVRFCNLSRPETTTEGGRASAGNARRTIADGRRVWRESSRADAVSIHSAMNPLPTILRAAFFAAIARLRGVPTVAIHAHGGGLRSWLKTPLQRRLVRLLLRPANVLVTVAEGERAVLAGAVAPARVQLVENGVDASRFTQQRTEPAGVPRVVYLGVLSERKGVLDLVDASRRLRAQGVDHELVLVGGTPAEGDAAEREVRDAAAGFATVTGPVPPHAVPELLAHAAVFCLPSWYEAMPLSVLEAMAAGTPVVATSVGDIPRLVVDEESGLLVPPHDVDALVGALTRLLGSTELRRRLGDAGRRRQREHFDVGRMVIGVECALGLPTSDT